MAWLSGYSKRKKITLTGGTSGAQTNFQIKLAITFDSDMQLDFDDLRFTQSDGESLINAWLESKVDSTSAVVWVKFPTTPANGVNQDYYMYYGYPGATSDWDIGETMVFGDDFEGGNLDKWTKPEGVPAIVSNPDGTGNVLKLNYSSDEQVLSVGTLAKPFILEYNARSDAIDDGGVCGLSTAAWASGNYQVVAIGYPNSSNWGYIKAGGSWTTTGHAYSINTWYKLIHTRKDSSFDVTEDDVLIVNNVSDTAAQTLCLFRSRPADTVWINNVFIHKYAANPATYGFGSEENAPPMRMVYQGGFNTYKFNSVQVTLDDAQILILFTHLYNQMRA